LLLLPLCCELFICKEAQILSVRVFQSDMEEDAKQPKVQMIADLCSAGCHQIPEALLVLCILQLLLLLHTTLA